MPLSRPVHPGPQRPPPPPLAHFRFWLDEVLWSQGHVAVQLVEAALVEAGGVRVGGPARVVDSRVAGVKDR